MASQEHLWGPEFEYYSQNFDPRESTISDESVTAFYSVHGVPPLAVLENTMCAHDIVEHNVGIIQQCLGEITRIFQRYTAMNRAKVFKNYYGFLCVRQILHLACLAILSTSHPGTHFYHSLDSTASYRKLAHIVALKAMEEVGEGFSRGELAINILNLGGQLGQISGASGENAVFPLVTHKLWEDRDTFLTLCACGLLPGCSLLICTLYAYGPASSGDQDFYTLLKDLAIRQYLIGSNRDRPILEVVCTKIFPNCKALESWEATRFVPSRNSRGTSQAYAGLLYAFQQDLADVESISVNMAGFLSDLALEAVGSDPSATIKGICNTVHCTFEYFWLILARPFESLVDGQRGIRYFVSHIFTFIQTVVERQTSLSHQEKHWLALMFAKSNLISLVGRILLLTIQPESLSGATGMEYLPAFLMSFTKLQIIVADWAQASPAVFHDSQCDLVKLIFLLGSIALGRIGKPLAGWQLTHVQTMAELMISISTSFLGGDIESHACGYPRCFPLPVSVPVPGAGYWCKKCRRVAYCGPKCQLAHWNMMTSESHKLGCGGFHGR
ncbi:hypothetical protein FRC08_008494 [Ceratobasidium sp. 394]|nr:hypothetical protein FRC08_008494 [Ceratobasidium sp. 394]